MVCEFYGLEFNNITEIELALDSDYNYIGKADSESPSSLVKPPIIYFLSIARRGKMGAAKLSSP